MPTFREDLHTGHKVPLVETDDLMDKSVTLPKLGDDVFQFIGLLVNNVKEECNAKANDLQAQIDDLQYQIDCIKAGGVLVSMTVEPPKVAVGVPTDVRILVTTNMEATSIVVMKGDIVIGEASDATRLEVTDHVLADTETSSIDYSLVATVNGEDVRKYVSLEVVKQETILRWSANSAQVLTTADISELPTLYNPSQLPIIYSVEHGNGIAEFTNNTDYNSLVLLGEGSCSIKATYEDPTGVRDSVTVGYTLGVERDVYDGLRWSKNQYEATIGEENNFPVLFNPLNKPIAYSSDATEVATINAVGEVTLVAAGNAMIYANFPGDNIYKPKEVAYDLNVLEEEACWTVGGIAATEYHYTVDLNSSSYTGDEIKIVGVNLSAGQYIGLSWEEKNSTSSHSSSFFFTWRGEAVFDSSTNVLTIPNKSWYPASHTVGGVENAPAECWVTAQIKTGTGGSARVVSTIGTLKLFIEKADIPVPSLSSISPVEVHLSRELAPGETETFNNTNGLPTIVNYNSSYVHVSGGTSAAGISSITLKNNGVIEVAVSGTVDNHLIIISTGGSILSEIDCKVKYYALYFRLTVLEAQVNSYWRVGDSPNTTWNYTLLSPVPTVQFMPGNGIYTGVTYKVYDYLGYPAPYNTGSAWNFSITSEGVVTPPYYILNGSTEFNYTIEAWRGEQNLATLSVHLNLASWDFNWDFDGTVHEPWGSGGTIQVVTVYAETWGGTSYKINRGLPSISGTVIADNVSQDSEGSYHSNKVVIVKEEGTNNYTVTITGDITSMTEIRMHATKGRDTQHGNTDRIYMLRILPPSIPDYYVGWYKGLTFTAFANQTASDLVNASTSYSKTANPTNTKTVTADDVSGVTREIYFLMWKDGSAPTGGSLTSGGFTTNLNAQSFSDTNIFNATHSDVTIGVTTYHVVGIRGAFDAGDTLIISFN